MQTSRCTDLLDIDRLNFQPAVTCADPDPDPDPDPLYLYAAAPGGALVVSDSPLTFHPAVTCADPDPDPDPMRFVKIGFGLPCQSSV